MKTKQKLILLNGFAASGKTTLAKRYIDDYPLALGLEHDEIVVMLGQWEENEKEAREKVFLLMENMVTTHLRSGKDVILPYLLTDSHHAEHFENIANEAGVEFIEVMLSKDKEKAIKHLLDRGCWGEKGLPPLTDEDLPSIETLYDTMTKATSLRPDTISINPIWNNVDKTYNLLLEAISNKISNIE